MKYLIAFEKHIDHENNDIKKYFVMEFPTNLIVLKKINDGLAAKRIYIYRKENNKLHTGDDSIYDISVLDANRILYSSDDEQDVLDKLLFLSDIKKFNI